jgi:hypothetical protein
MATRGARGELASARLELPPTRHARTKGRNGWFTPRLIEAVVHKHRDGTQLITLRQYSRRAPARAGAPWECTLPLQVYREFARSLDGALVKSLTNRRSRASDRGITG